jgi:hypothetical protein
MKTKFSLIALAVGLALGLGPWCLLSNPSPWWYLVSMIGLVLVCTAGMGAQMDQMGQGDTGEKLLRSMWHRLMNRFK